MGKLHPCDINAENEQDVYFRFFFFLKHCQLQFDKSFPFACKDTLPSVLKGFSTPDLELHSHTKESESACLMTASYF